MTGLMAFYYYYYYFYIYIYIYLFIFESNHKVALKITLSINTKSLLCVNGGIYVDGSYTKLKGLRGNNHV